MNTPEVTMHSSHNFIALEVATEAAGIVLKLAGTVPSHLRSIADQAIRAACSVPANLSEGHGRIGRDRAKHWRIAYAEAKEIDVHLRLLQGAGVIDFEKSQRALSLFDQVRAMIWRLLHP